MSRYIGDGHPSSVARAQPVLLLHGANDADVPLHFARTSQAALAAARIPSALRVLPSGEHQVRTNSVEPLCRCFVLPPSIVLRRASAACLTHRTLLL